jgi:coenzyme PQQ precursor peptide PqqA
MSWEAPQFEEVKMDAEINSYQDDFDRDDDV